MLYDSVNGTPKSTLKNVNDCCGPVTVLCLPSALLLNWEYLRKLYCVMVKPASSATPRA